MTRSRIWTIGTAAVVAAILVGGWFLLVSPTRAKAADVKQQTASQEAANAQLTSRIEQLKVQAQDLPEQEAKIAAFRQHIPAGPQLPSFIRQLSNIADESGVTLVSMAPENPQTLSVQGATATATTSGTTEDGSAALSLNATTATSLQYIQAKVAVRGGYFNTEQFFTKLEKLDRSFLVTGFVVSADTASDAQPGDVATDLQVRVFYAKTFTATSAGGAATLPSTTPAN